MIVRGAFDHLLRPGLREEYLAGYEEYEEEWSRLVRTGTMDRAELEAVTLSGIPRAVERGEGEPFTVFDPVLSDKVTYTDVQFGSAISISKEMVEDDLYGRANQSAKWLGRSTRLAQEYAVADLYDDAFDGSTYTGFEGEVLCSETHTLLNSANTWSNRINGDPELGIASLQAAFELGEQTLDHQGDPTPVRIDYLTVNIPQEWMAIQLTQNSEEPFTADRNINTTMRKRKLGYTVSHYKDQSGKDWFARDSQIYKLYLLWKIRPQYPDWFKEETQTMYFAGRQRFLVYFYEQRGMIGSNAT